MKKQEILDNIDRIFWELQEKVKDGEGMTKEEVKRVYDEIFYIKQQGGLSNVR